MVTEKIQAYYYIGTMTNVYTKVYDGKELQADVLTYQGYLNDDSFQAQITDGNITHVNEYGTMVKPTSGGAAYGTLNLLYDEGYPKVFRNGDDVTDEYNQTQVTDPTFEDKTPGYKTFTIIARDLTIQSGSQSWEYDGYAHSCKVVNDLTAGQTDKGFVQGEELNYSNFATITFVGEKDNDFDYTDGTALVTDYNVTKQTGTLTITKRTAPLTITVDNQARMYDGTTAFDANAYTVTGDLAYNDKIYVTLSNDQKDVGSHEIGVSYKIMHDNGDGTFGEVTDMYANITVNDGYLDITKRDVTLTSASDEKTYDGTPLTNSEITVSGSGWVEGEGATYNVTGSQTEVGSSKNTFAYELKSNTKADNYEITTVEGTLTVKPMSLSITVGLDLTTGLTFMYDGTATKVLTESQYQVVGLADGDKVTNVTITTDSSNVDVYDGSKYTLTYDVINAETGADVKGNYEITETKNDIAITPRTIVIKAGSASKVYDGTALTCNEWSVAEGGDGLVETETIEGVAMTKDSTITHVGSTANKVDPSNVTITKADGSDSSMNYVVETLDGTLTVTQRQVLLISTNAEKYYDGTALQNRQVIVTGPSYLEGKPVEGEGFLPGDGCTYNFVGDDVVIDAEGNIVAKTVSEQSGTAYGQTDVGTSKNEFNYDNFTSVYFNSNETDYEIVYGNNVPQWFIDKYGQAVADDLFGDLTVWGGPVEIKMTDYSWTYDYQSKTNGYFDDGYTVIVTTNEEGTEQSTTKVEHYTGSEGQEIALLGNDKLVVTVTGQGGSVETGKVSHVVNEDGTTSKQNVATYKIYRDDQDVTDEVKDFYNISVDGGVLKITARDVQLTSGSAIKRYDGTALTDNTVTEGSEGALSGFIFGEGAAYEVTGSQTAIGTSNNTFAISKLLTDTVATDYNFNMVEGSLTVIGSSVSEYNYTNKSDIIQCVNGLVFAMHDTEAGYVQSAALNDVSGWDVTETRRDLTGDSLCDVQITKDAGNGTTWVATLRNDYLQDGALTLNYQFIGAYNNKLWSYIGSADVNGDGKAEVLMEQTVDGADGAFRHVAAWVTDSEGKWVGNEWVGSVNENAWDVAGTADIDGNGTDNVILRRADGMIGYWTEAGTNDVAEIWNAGKSVMLTSADFSGDAADDLLFTNADGDFFTWSNIGSGVYSERIGNIDDLGGSWAFAGAGDFNGDGKEEILWCDGVSTAYSEATKENFSNLIALA